MPVSITSTIKDVELAYGRDIITCFNSSGGSNRIVLQVFDAGSNAKIADLRQLPNNGSYAHFDISRILQSQVAQSPKQGDDTSGTIRYFTNPDECFDFYFKVGTLNATNGNVTIDATYSGSVVDDYLVIPGRKPPTYTNGSVNWEDYSSYVPQVGTNVASNNAAIPEIRQLALTDYNFDSINYNDITDGKPGAGEFPVPTEDIYRIKVYRDTDHTLQFLQRWVEGVVGGAPPYYNGVNYTRFVTFNGNTQLADLSFANITSEGGGPNGSYTDQSTPTGEYGIIGVKSGFNNTTLTTSGLTHMYVWVECQADDTFVSQDGTRISYAYRIDIEDGECNDYDIIQVKWLNSVGGTDYFTFQKKNEERINVKRETYNQTNTSWAGPQFTQFPYERGERVFNQFGEQTFTANTRYLSDGENQYLKNLYLSPDVKVKFGTDINAPWESVVLTSNTWTERTFRKDKLFQHTINFKLANKLNYQGG